MSSDCFLKLKSITGEASDKDHSGEIQVVSWDWGVSAAGGAPGGKLGDTRHLVVTHRLDAASPALMMYCLRGTIIPNAVLTMRKASGDKALPYFTAKLERVRVADVSNGLSGDGETHEIVSLTFDKVEVSYTPQTSSGGGGGAVTQQWSVKDER